MTKQTLRPRTILRWMLAKSPPTKLELSTALHPIPMPRTSRTSRLQRPQFQTRQPPPVVPMLRTSPTSRLQRPQFETRQLPPPQASLSKHRKLLRHRRCSTRFELKSNRLVSATTATCSIIGLTLMATVAIPDTKSLPQNRLSPSKRAMVVGRRVAYGFQPSMEHQQRTHGRSISTILFRSQKHGIPVRTAGVRLDEKPLRMTKRRH